MSWAEYCTSIKNQATQFADISLFCDKRKQMIAAERARQSSSNRLDGNEDIVKMDDSTGELVREAPVFTMHVTDSRH